MSVSQIIFYCISAFILGAGLLSVTSRKIFRSAIWLLFSLIGVAGMYFWMEMEFIAAVQIVIYVGGIVVLIIFSIFLTQQSGIDLPKESITRLIAGGLAALIGFALSFMLISRYPFPASNPSDGYDVSAIGNKMLSTGADGFALPFEVVSILLLAAMIGCIVIAMRAPQQVSGLKSFGVDPLKPQNPAPVELAKSLQPETQNPKPETN
ncbi:MAG: NADH-quinone oxidoreductase subunit J [Chitinophagales bacterium]|nr:NADH-quinone oxidoreductase subunit J [Chitinophagales bacterium]